MAFILNQGEVCEKYYWYVILGPNTRKSQPSIEIVILGFNLEKFQSTHYGTKSKKVAKTPNLKILKLVSIFILMIPKEIYFHLVRKNFILMLKKHPIEVVKHRLFFIKLQFY